MRPRVRLGGIGVLDVRVGGRRVFSRKAEPSVTLDDVLQRLEAAARG